MHISSVNPVPWLEVNLHRLFQMERQLIQSRSSLQFICDIKQDIA